MRIAERTLSNLFKVKSISLGKFIGGFDIEEIGETIIDLVVDAGYGSLEAIKNDP